MYMTEQQVRAFEQQVVNQTLSALHMCTKCMHARYSAAQFVARYKLLRPNKLINLIPDINPLINRLREKHGCVGCSDLRLTTIICLLDLMRSLNIYDARKSRM